MELTQSFAQRLYIENSRLRSKVQELEYENADLMRQIDQINNNVEPVQ